MRTTRTTSRPAILIHALTLLGLGAAAVLTGCHGGQAGHESAASPSGVKGRYILALGDADLPSEPMGASLLPNRPGSKDSLTVISLPIREPSTPFAQVDVSSSALGSPGEIAVSPDGRFVFVAETRGPAPAGGERSVASLPIGDSFTCIDLTNPQSPVVLGKTFVGPDPRALAVHPSGDFLAVVTTSQRNQLTVAPIRDGKPGEAVAWPLLGLDDDEAKPTAVAWHPSGRALCVSLGARGELVFYRFRAGADGMALAPWGGPVKVGNNPIMGLFTKDGKHFISLDAGTRGTAPDSQPAGPGQLTVVGVADNVESDDASGPHTPRASAETGISPVGMAISPDGSTIAVANALMSVNSGGGHGGSVILYTLHRDGSLSRHAEFVLNAVPAGVAFDTSGRFVCVSQYASLDPEASDGEVSFWEVVRRNGAPGLKQQDFFLGIGGGPHGSLIVR